MNRIRILVAIVAMLFVGHTAMAQNLDRVIGSLEQSAMGGNRVRVIEDSDTRDAVRLVESQRKSKETSGFRVVIFSAHGQYAGDNAERVLNEFKSQFPEINAYLVYESPYFKISVGDCLSMEEAQILMARVTPYYPKAYPKRETIRYEDLANVREKPASPIDSLAVEVLIEENAQE